MASQVIRWGFVGRNRGLRLEHCPDRDSDVSPVAEWERWRVRDLEGNLVGFVAEWHDHDGMSYGPATFTATHNPSGEPFAALWHEGGFATPREACDALETHLRAP